MSAQGNTDPRAGVYMGPMPDARCVDCDRVLDDVEVPRCKDCRECGDVHRPPGWVCTEPAGHDMYHWARRSQTGLNFDVWW